ncbi:MAG TPA: DUF87 domain-containing protein [Syntrophorhabdus sp.]|nr:DUF87 domain-containing protein [Syntrophorhabdus sp.]
MKMNTLNQPVRLLILAIYIGLLVASSQLVFGSWLPPTSEKGLWFYSGLAALLLGNLLVSPFFTKPVDSISYGVAALIALLTINPSKYSEFDSIMWLIVLIYLVIIIIAGILSISTKSSNSDFVRKVSQSLFTFCDSFGSARFVFSLLFLFALVVFHRDNHREFLIIGGSWAFFVGLQPLENIVKIIGRFWTIWSFTKPIESCGEIVGHQVPGIVLLRKNEDVDVQFGDLLVVRADDGQLGTAIALDYVGFAEGLWLRLLHLNITPELRREIQNHFSRQDECQAVKIDKNYKTLTDQLQFDKILKQRSALLGIVAPDTDSSRLRIELVRNDVDLAEGMLVEANIGTKTVLYQIINGITKEEIVEQRNTRGYVRADAKKIGYWNQSAGRFEDVKWVPQPNSPIFLVQASVISFHKDMVGYFPDTDYPVTIDSNLLVTHNTAILGILGVGKSFLAIELVERIIKDDIKVICLDLTNQYAKELDQYYSLSEEQSELDELASIGISGGSNVQQNVEEGGSIQQFHDLAKEKIKVFLDTTNQTKKIKIFNPAQYEVWRQDSKPFSGKASMVALTPTEITRIFAEATLEVLQEQGMSDRAKCCIVFEEAHSLVPEWNAVASEGDKTATNGTAKAILQGRKYGLGCILITQRTANVTKTILNQCNTIFALRIFDATGMDFLKNYIGEDYAGVLSTLEDRYAVVFGRASSCRDPVLIRLNDRNDFIRTFRQP